MGNDILMDVQHLSHIFRLNRKVEVHAVDDVSFQIKKGEIYGLVGESGSGKSTVARCVMNIYLPQDKSIIKEFQSAKTENLKRTGRCYR
mgnify:CR=1 FL=1